MINLDHGGLSYSLYIKDDRANADESVLPEVREPADTRSSEWCC